MLGGLTKPNKIVPINQCTDFLQEQATCTYQLLLPDLTFLIARVYTASSLPEKAGLFYISPKGSEVAFFGLDIEKGFKTPELCCAYIDEKVCHGIKSLIPILDKYIANKRDTEAVNQAVVVQRSPVTEYQIGGS